MGKGGLRWRRTLTVCKAPVSSISALPVSRSLTHPHRCIQHSEQGSSSPHSTLRAHTQNIFGVPRLSLLVVGGDAHLVVSFFPSTRTNSEVERRMELPRTELPRTTSHAQSSIFRKEPIIYHIVLIGFELRWNDSVYQQCRAEGEFSRFLSQLCK